jgi:hypothetical protein
MSTCEKIGVNWRLGDDVEDETMGHNLIFAVWHNMEVDNEN